MLDSSIPSVLFLGGLPKVDIREELDVTIVLSFVGAQVMSVVLGGPPVDR